MCPAHFSTSRRACLPAVIDPKRSNQTLSLGERVAKPGEGEAASRAGGASLSPAPPPEGEGFHVPVFQVKHAAFFQVHSFRINRITGFAPSRVILP